MRIEIELNRDDLFTRFKETPEKELTLQMFNIERDLIQRARVIKFVDDEREEYKVLKNAG